MKPQNLKTRIFLDSGDPKETKQAINMLGFLDGQTTNPTLILKNPAAQKRLAQGRKFTKEEILALYKEVVQEISQLIPQGSVSIEVYADETTSAEEMLMQAREMFAWIPNAHIKFPIIKEGIRAAHLSLQEGMRVNMTLCFSQEQAAAVFNAVGTVERGRVYLSPFVGRLDDRGENGMDLIKNIIVMRNAWKSNVEVLVASVRKLEHLLYAVALGADIATAPLAILKEWSDKGLPLPDEKFIYQPSRLAAISYQEFDSNKNWQDFNIEHPLTTAGIKKFVQDWNSLLQ